MMNFPGTHPVWMWLYFGVFGTSSTVLFILALWNVVKIRKSADKKMRKTLQLSMIGYMFLFIASWFACGIGGPPGNLLSADLSAHNQLGAVGAASASMFFSVPGWLFLFLSHRSMIRSMSGEIIGK